MRKDKNKASTITQKSIKLGQKIYTKFFDQSAFNNDFPDIDYTNQLIADGLRSDKAFMVSRLGHFEAEAVFNHQGVLNPTSSISSIIKRKAPLWWWDKELMQQLYINAGLFPISEEITARFCELIEQDAQETDVLGSWLKLEGQLDQFIKHTKKVKLHYLEPFFSKTPWTKELEGKKVLVVHPFFQSISQQYAIRDKIFENGLLPDFSLTIIPAVQSISGHDKRFGNWFEALDYMKNEISSADYDICIIGAGAYGLSLAAHVKREGKKALHLGGVTQILFGVKGLRWEKFIDPPYKTLFNDYWIRPQLHETPNSAKKVENACYW